MTQDPLDVIAWHHMLLEQIRDAIVTGKPATADRDQLVDILRDVYALTTLRPIEPATRYLQTKTASRAMYDALNTTQPIHDYPAGFYGRDWPDSD